MKKIILALSMFASVMTVSARQQSHNYNRSVYRAFNSLAVNEPAGTTTRKIFSKAFPGWSVFTDKLNGTISIAYGPGIELTGNTPLDKANFCISQKLKDLGISKDDWKLVSNTRHADRTYLYFEQSIGAHKVFMSRLSFQFSNDGKLLKIEMKNYGRPDNNAVPAIKAGTAISAACAELDGVIISDKKIENEWAWFPVPANGGYLLRPSWRFAISGKAAGTPVKLSGYVDGITGELLYRTNQVKDDYNLTVKGSVYKNGTLNPATNEPLPEIQLGIGFSNYITDTAGFFTDPLLVLPLSTSISLSGNWSTVYDQPTGMIPSATNMVNILGTVFNFPTAAPSSSRHINAYYHVNRVHNFMKGYFPSFYDLDFPLPTNVDVMNGNCNAYYDGSSINFFAADNTCNSFAELGDVVYHEYGHGISDYMYTDIAGITIQNSALNEANSDIWALSITRSPILSENMFVTFQGFGRRYDMTPQIYPQDISLFGDPHQTGQIIAGAWWDVGQNIGSIDTMTRLFTSVYYSVPDGMDGQEGYVYQTILIDALLADDDDNNIGNGTPHYKQIVAAFAKHGIYLEGDVTLTHQELNNVQAAAALPVTATLSMSQVAAFQNLLVYYRRHGSNIWDSAVMTSTNNINYSVNIPAQDTGALLDYYFCIHDALNVANAYFPLGYNPALPSNQSTIPYQFGVGLTAIDTVDFESAPTGWHIANNTGDNAVAGRWARVAPVQSSFFPAWPDADHTGGTGTKCLLTGNGSSQPTMNCVSQGATSVLTSNIDISSYSEPVIVYYRWFSNDMGENFKNDPWQVMIKDAAGNSWKTVENTYQSDYSWRKRIFAVKEYLPSSTSSIQLKFIASDSILSNWWDYGQSLTVGGIDDFYIYDAKKHTTGITNLTSTKVSIYPNPADKQLDITLPEINATYSISICDMSGKKVYTTQTRGQAKLSINTRQFEAGIYTLLIQTENGLQMHKVVIAHK